MIKHEMKKLIAILRDERPKLQARGHFFVFQPNFCCVWVKKKLFHDVLNSVGHLGFLLSRKAARRTVYASQ